MYKSYDNTNIDSKEQVGNFVHTVTFGAHVRNVVETAMRQDGIYFGSVPR